jgi:hypothetical protein
MASSPPLPQPLDIGQILGQSASGVTKLSDAASKANVSGVNLGMSTLANYLTSDGRTLTIDPAEKAKLDKAIKDAEKKTPKAEKTVANLEKRVETLNEQIAAAEAAGNTKRAASLRATLAKTTPKLETAQTQVQKLQTTVTDSQAALRTTGPSISEVYREADAKSYEQIDRARGFANQIGQVSPEGQRYLDAASQGYQARDLGTNAITASQISPVNDIAAQQVQAARIGDFGRANAVNAANVADIRAGQVGMGQLGGNLMQQALQKSLSDGSLNAQGTRDAIQSARQGFAARGLATGNASMAAELLNRDRYSRQRQFEDLQFAGGVQGQDLGRQFQNVGNQLTADRSNQETAARISLSNQQAAMQAEMANLEARKQAAITQGQMEQAASLANQQANLAASTQNQNTQFALGQTNAQLSQQASLSNQEDARLTATFNEQNRLTGTQQNLSQLGAASNYVDAQNNAGFAAAADMANIESNSNPLFRNLGTSQQNFFGTNQLGTAALGPAVNLAGNVASFNANMAASTYNSHMNNQAALQGAQMQAGAASQAGTMGMIGSGVGMAVGIGAIAI